MNKIIFGFGPQMTSTAYANTKYFLIERDDVLKVIMDAISLYGSFGGKLETEIIKSINALPYKEESKCTIFYADNEDIIHIQTLTDDAELKEESKGGE